MFKKKIKKEKYQHQTQTFFFITEPNLIAYPAIPEAVSYAQFLFRKSKSTFWGQSNVVELNRKKISTLNYETDFSSDSPETCYSKV